MVPSSSLSDNTLKYGAGSSSLTDNTLKYGTGSSSLSDNTLKQWFPKCAQQIPGETATSSQGISGYISVMAALKFTHFLITEIMSC